MTNKDAWDFFGYPGKKIPDENGGLKCVTGDKDNNGWGHPAGGWKTSTQWKIIVDDKNKEIHIAFQYSKGKLDWLLNLIFPGLPLPLLTKKIGNCRVHLGMWLKLANVQSELWKKIHDYRKQQYKIYLYGHSQGGGFAKIVHAWLAAEGVRVHRTITWGALRVFTWFSNTKWFADDIASYEHRSDIVPSLPFFFMGFQGCGRRIKCGKTLYKWYEHFIPWRWYKKEYTAHTSYGEFE